MNSLFTPANSHAAPANTASAGAATGMRGRAGMQRPPQGTMARKMKTANSTRCTVPCMMVA